MTWGECHCQKIAASIVYHWSSSPPHPGAAKDMLAPWSLIT